MPAVSERDQRAAGRVDEVARVAGFLGDPASGYITGQVYSLNGDIRI